MPKYAEIVVEDNIIYVFHPEEGNREIVDKLNLELELTLKKMDLSKQIFFCSDLTKTRVGLVDKDLNDYKKTGEEFITKYKHLNMINIFVVSGTLIRVLAGALSILSGKKSHFFKTLDEARRFIKENNK